VRLNKIFTSAKAIRNITVSSLLQKNSKRQAFVNPCRCPQKGPASQQLARYFLAC